jgi:hypothetical protein
MGKITGSFGHAINSFISALFDGFGYIRMFMFMVYSWNILMLVTVVIVVVYINRIMTSIRLIGNIAWPLRRAIDNQNQNLNLNRNQNLLAIEN